MANVNNPNGASPIRTVDGSPWNQQANLYHIPSTDGSAYYVGDFVKSSANGDARGIPDVAKAASGNTLRGVIVGVFVVPPIGMGLSQVGTSLSLEITSVPATKTRDYYLAVVDAPGTIFEIMDDGSAALTATSCNKNANFTVAAPTSPQQQSGTALTASTVATTQAFSLKIMGLVQRPNNNYGVNARWQVLINQHELMGNTAGV